MSNGNFKFVQINVKHLLYFDQSLYVLGYNTTSTYTKYDTANSRHIEPHRIEKHILALTYDEFENILMASALPSVTSTEVSVSDVSFCSLS